MADKTRVHNLAKELNVTSKAILKKCADEGIEIKNHMSTVTAGLQATIREWFSEGVHQNVVETAGRIDLEKARSAAKRKRRAAKKSAASSVGGKSDDGAGGVATATAEPPAEVVGETAPTVEAEAPQSSDVDVSIAADAAASESGAGAPAGATPAAAADKPGEPGESAAPVVPTTVEVPVGEPAESAASAAAQATDAEPGADAGQVAAQASDDTGVAESVSPAGPQNVPAPAKLSGPRVVRYEAPEEYALPRRGPRRREDRTGELGISPAYDVPSRPRGRRKEEPDKGVAKKGRRTQRREIDVHEKISEWNDQDLAERRARLRGATGRRMSARRAAERTRSTAHAGPITTAEVHEPIIIKDLCGAIGQPFSRIFPILKRDHGLMLTTNSILPSDIAEMVALEFGVELTVVEARTKLDEIREEFKALPRENLTIRPPIVAVLGHVDHGKTSLLDRIRRAGVASGEDGGITQHISSYHYKQGDVAVTFLDTPGHEAFTALRARGARITDVAVLVVAADDGVMPQTLEAINHIKAADVPIVVALNKIDLGDQNVQKIYGQLAEQGLTPSGDWGGEVDVIHTSATTGEGVDELLAHLSALAEIHEYKADPTIPATGTVVESESRQGVGAVLQVVIKEGTLKVGDVVLAGHSYGKIRAIVDDHGARLKQAGPSMPVELWGLNEVAHAGDDFFAVANMQRAKEAAEEIKRKRQSDARAQVSKARSIEDLLQQRSDAEIPELNVIVRADVDGSVDALVGSLERFSGQQVKLNILHSGVGAVTDSDVQLAKASHAIVVAFRVVASAQTRKLAEQEGVDIRPYKVIYDVTDDIRQAMEGLLAPDEVMEQRATVEVRELFRMSKVGLVAGCYVRDGVVSSNHVARVVRDGAIVRENCKFASLRRFKDDVKEVRAGMECGIRLQGFDDVKVGDAIETFEVVQVARKLEQ